MKHINNPFLSFFGPVGVPSCGASRDPLCDDDDEDCDDDDDGDDDGD